MNHFMAIECDVFCACEFDDSGSGDETEVSRFVALAAGGGIDSSGCSNGGLMGDEEGED